MARPKNVEDLTTLQMALVGYEFEKRKIEDKISELRAKLKGKRVPPSADGAAPKKAPGTTRFLSPAARKRIANAQKKRWAEHRKRIAQAAKAE